MKERRNGSLIRHINDTMPNVGNVKLDNPRLAYCTFRGKDFAVSSRLTVTECGFGRGQDIGRTIVTEDATYLQGRMRGEIMR